MQRCASIPRGAKIRVTSFTGWPAENPRDFDELVTFEYIDDSHINCITEHGSHVGLPTCYVVGIEVVEES